MVRRPVEGKNLTGSSAYTRDSTAHPVMPISLWDRVSGWPNTLGGGVSFSHHLLDAAHVPSGRISSLPHRVPHTHTSSDTDHLLNKVNARDELRDRVLHLEKEKMLSGKMKERQ